MTPGRKLLLTMEHRLASVSAICRACGCDMLSAMLFLLVLREAK
jgi:hypothetical protein